MSNFSLFDLPPDSLLHYTPTCINLLIAIDRLDAPRLHPSRRRAPQRASAAWAVRAACIVRRLPPKPYAHHHVLPTWLACLGCIALPPLASDFDTRKSALPGQARSPSNSQGC